MYFQNGSQSIYQKMINPWSTDLLFQVDSSNNELIVQNEKKIVFDFFKKIVFWSGELPDLASREAEAVDTLFKESRPPEGCQQGGWSRISHFVHFFCIQFLSSFDFFPDFWLFLLFSQFFCIFYPFLHFFTAFSLSFWAFLEFFLSIFVPFFPSPGLAHS